MRIATSSVPIASCSTLVSPAVHGSKRGAADTVSMMPVASVTIWSRITPTDAAAGDAPASIVMPASPANCQTAPGIYRARFVTKNTRRPLYHGSEEPHHEKLLDQS